MNRDIDYAAIAVRTALTEKFGRRADLQALQVTANEKTISVRDGDHAGEDTRDKLLAAVRAAAAYEDFWKNLAPPD